MSIKKLEYATVDKIKSLPWQAAMDYAASLGEGWRLPTVKELGEVGKIKDIKDIPDDYYWSSSTYVIITDYAWVVDLWGGDANYGDKTDSYYAWPVREEEGGK